MVERFRPIFFCLAAGCGLTAIACGSGGGDTTEGTDPTTDTSTGGATDGSGATDSTAGPPTTSGVSVAGTDTGDASTGSDTGTGPGPTTGSESTAPGSETQGVDASESGGSSGPGDTTGPGDTSSTGDDTGSTGSGGSTGDESSTTDDTDGCVPTEQNEVTCDNLDNDCDGEVDDIDLGGDGICDCLDIGILGNVGFAPTSDFETWLEDQGTTVTRTLLMNNPGVVTPALLANYDIVLIDRIERALAPAEAMALSDFVKQEGRGVITLIGYNYDNNNPAPERDRANTALAPFGLAYQGPYFGDNVVPMFDQAHPIGMGIADVNFQGGIEPVDLEMQGTSEVFATTQMKTAGLAHQTAMGGRVVVWGDEWITFDDVWQGYVDVEPFWVNMFDWVRPQDSCVLPQ